MSSNSERVPIGRIILGTLVVAGMVPLLPLLPGLGVTIRMLGLDRKVSPRYVARALRRLEEKGFVKLEGRGINTHIRITDAGKRELERHRRIMTGRPKRRPWDGTWRIVIFDVPVKMKKLRDNLRNELKQVGFKKLQDSVYVTPDECEEYVKLLKADARIGKSLIYIETSKLEYAGVLKKKFTIHSQ